MSPSPERSPTSRPRPAWLLALLVSLGLPTLFSGGTCTWRVHHHDCDDKDFDDHCDRRHDHNHSAAGAGLDQDPEDPYRLVKFERVASHVPGAHPVAWLRHIQGINLFHEEGPVSYEEADFEMFTGLLLQANKDLLGLPRSAGLLTFDGVEFEKWSLEPHDRDAGLRVRWRQEARQPDGSWQPVPGSEVVFHFDAVGNLLTVRNHTWVRPPQR